MADLIHLLPDSVANQIAAGEVIQRPASVVKELVENAIDSGATNIKVRIVDAGKTIIQVIDNGCGMSETDARMAFERHATSKIKTADDLYSLQTMGFRGEALPSIAAVAQVELRTKIAENDYGVSIQIEGSKIVGHEIISCPQGSNFIVKNLFYNIPARRKFLKSNQTEFNNIVQEFERITLGTVGEKKHLPLQRQCGLVARSSGSGVRWAWALVQLCCLGAPGLCANGLTSPSLIFSLQSGSSSAFFTCHEE